MYDQDERAVSGGDGTLIGAQGLLTQDDVAKRELSPLERQMRRQEELLNGLHKATEMLAIKLMPITQASTDGPRDQDETSSDEGSSGLVTALQSNNNNIQIALRHINTLTRKLEV